MSELAGSPSDNHSQSARPERSASDRPSELARAIRVALDYPDELRRMGDAARAHVAAELSWERSVRQLQALYSAQADWIAA